MLGSEETMAASQIQFLPMKSLPNCPMRVELNCLHIKLAHEDRLGTFFGSKILKADNTSFVEDLNRLDMLSLMSLIKGLTHSLLKRAYI